MCNLEIKWESMGSGNYTKAIIYRVYQEHSPLKIGEIHYDGKQSWFLPVQVIHIDEKSQMAVCLTLVEMQKLIKVMEELVWAKGKAE